MKFPARLLSGALVSIFSVIVLLSLIPSPISHAYTPDDFGNTTNSDVPQNSHTETQILFINFSSALICQLAGIDILNPQQGCLGIDPLTKRIGYAGDANTPGQAGGLLSFSSTMIGKLYTPPASSIQSVQYLAQNFGIAKNTYAQDANTGFTALEPLQSLWLLSRNLVFIILVLVFVIIGIGIMLRFKIDPRTVMTIQNQLPRIIIAIILITFSYSIVGFMIDMMWTGTYFVINTLGESAPDGTVAQASSNLYNNPIYYLNDLLKDGSLGDDFMLAKVSQDIGFTIGDLISGVIMSVLGAEGNIGGNCSGGDLFKEAVTLGIWDTGSSIGECVEYAFYNILGFFIGIIALLIVLIALLIALFRVWFSLLKAYIYIILYTFLAPFFIMMGLLPNSTLSFGSWFRRIVANLAVFPAVVGLFIVAHIFLRHEQLNASDPTAFIPPLVGNPNISNNIGTLIAFGVVLLTPSILDMIKEGLKAQGNSTAAKAIQGGFMAGVGPGLALPKATIGRQLYYDKQTKDAGGLRYLGNKAFGRIPGNGVAKKVFGMKKIS